MIHDTFMLVDPVISWFYQNGRRDLPWRKDASPYRVWVSEIMLQQTRIEAATPYFLRFMQEIPSIEDLSVTDDDKLLKLWQGLGYYSRVRNLKKTAVEAVQKYGGLPRDFELLRSLPGIGDYTAGAIASIAFGLPCPAVDGNVLRVLSRFHADETDVMSPSAKKHATSALSAVYPTGTRAGLLTEGLMELGETVCLPNGKPRCEVCPLQTTCLAHATGQEEVLPVRIVKQKRSQEEWTVYLLHYQGRYALRRRPPQGLLASLWELPNVKGRLKEEEVKAQFAGATVTDLGRAEHIFTHKTWQMQGYLIELCAPLWDEDLVWATEQELKTTYAVPSAFRAFMPVR